MKNTRWCKVVSFCWLLLGLFYNPVIVAGGDPAASTLLPVDAATMGKVEQRDLQKPNLLLIVLDDAGYSDVKGFGRNDAPTPHLEQLANEGVRFTRHYADATCRPARISLMTGQQASRVALIPDFRGISPEFDTLPELLKTAGYSTHHIGKWHLGDTNRLAWPDAQGFDSWFGFLNQFLLRGPDKSGALNYRRPTYNNPWLQGDKMPLKKFKGHLTDILADAATSKITGLAGQSQPWFINYWMFAPHHPSIPDKRFQAHYPKTDAGRYLALLEQMDDAVGKVLKTLEETGQADNTVVVVLSDNGGTNKEIDNNAPFSGQKGLLFEGALRTPMIIRWPGKYRAGTEFDGIVAIWDVFPTLLKAAGVSVPSSIDGRDLSQMLEAGESPSRPLYWDFGSVHLYNYAMMEEGGQWRLHQDDLMHLAKDPSGGKNVAAEFPLKHTELKQRLIGWRDDVHRLKLGYETLGENGRARVTGDSMRRTPGFGGFTFAVDLEFPHKAPVTGQMLANQAAQWSLKLTPDATLKLTLNDETFESAKLPLGSTLCNKLVLTTYYLRSKLNAEIDKSIVTLWLNGKPVIDVSQPSPAEFPADIQQPTYLGQNPEGGELFEGRLGKPYLFNEFYYRDDPWQVGRDIARIENLLCQ